jgi:cation diffusion facilitator CzcD-associated flavoprotein CzcO
MNILNPIDRLANPPPLPDAAARIAALTQRVRRALEYLGANPPNWVVPREGMRHDAVIVGGGQTGVAIAFALRKVGIANFSVIDQAPASHEGVWRTCARMRTLRSPKHLPGPELGLDALTLRAWYEAKYGEQAYADILRCGTIVWADYVAWFRAATGIEVRNGTTLESIEPQADGFLLNLRTSGKPHQETTRKLILATGMVGSGAPSIPVSIAALPKDKWIHTDDVFDLAAYKGMSIGILGAASSAFDAAATALELGAREAHLFVRHSDLARITRIKGMSYPGALNHFHEFSDTDRWELMHYFLQRSSGPIAETVRRATQFPNFHLHFNAPWDGARMDGEMIEVEAAGKRFTFDRVIAGTGYRVDMSARPELANIAGEIALWRDRYVPPAAMKNEALAQYPYLGKGFEFLEKQPGAAPYLKNIHCVNNAALLSFGRAVGEITSIGHSVPRLVDRIGADFILDDRLAHFARMRAFNEPDLDESAYSVNSPADAGPD